MKLLYGVVLFVGVFTLINGQSAITLKRINTDQLLMQQLMQARASNPSNTVQCFNIYLPIYDAILQEFNSSYIQCSTDADAQNLELNEEAIGNQTLISQGAQQVCDSMTQCSALDDSLEFLDCYSSVGDTNIKSLYILTNNATDVAANLREAYRIVEVNLQRCQNASERAYVEGTGKATDALNDCLENGPPEVVTTTTPAPETTTLEPETTTEEDVTSESTTEETEAPAAEDLSMSAQLAPKLLTLSRFNRLNRSQLN